MAAAVSILHVGEDLCYRVPVMEAAGLFVFRSECSIEGVRTALAQDDGFSAVAFAIDRRPHFPTVVSTARSLTKAPLVLFNDLSGHVDVSAFDLVIVPEESPVWWLKSLDSAIVDARNVREVSRRIREESEAIREKSRALRAEAARNRRT
jgi:hypothetical protein